MTEKDFHSIGKRDALAEIIMLVRDKGERAALRQVAEALVKSDPDHPNPHAVWYLKENPE